MTEDSKASQNQTVFNQVVPVLDTTAEKPVPVPEPDTALEKPVPKKNRKLIIGLVIFFIIIIVLFIVSLVIVSTMPSLPPADDPTAQPTPTIRYEDNSLSAQIKLKREELKRLELGQDNLAFPQIDKKINIQIK